MRLLIFTQKVDKNDSVLGFFHSWIVEFSKKCESVIVICLYKGEYDLPNNVKVYSLGKEMDSNQTFKLYGLSTLWTRIVFLVRLYKFLKQERKNYDHVFVHMNEEYVLLSGLYWKLKNIPVYLWRNHPKGSQRTRLAVYLSTKVFCTSKDSFTARFRKTIIMPAGINTTVFRPVEGIVRKKYSVCVVGRIAPIKHIEKALLAVNKLVLEGAQISLSIIGSPGEKDMKYYDSLREYTMKNNLSNSVSFVEAMSPDKLPEVYTNHEVCLNLTEAGSFDKTIVESTSCGAIPLVTNRSLEHLLPSVCVTGESIEDIAVSLQTLLQAHVQISIAKDLASFVESQSLKALTEKLFTVIK